MTDEPIDAESQVGSARGQLLLATPGLLDPNFDRTVVFMLEHSDEGALGVVLNRPSELPVAGTVDDWGPVAADPPVIFVGGPVSPSSVIALATVNLDDAGEHWSPIVGRLGTVDLEMSPSEVPGLDSVRLFAGFASWAPGQLEAELVENAWYVVGAKIPDVHSHDPDELWWNVVGRQRGALGRLRNYPRDASDN